MKIYLLFTSAIVKFAMTNITMMKIILNNKPITLDADEISVDQLIKNNGIKSAGTAVSVNDILIRHSEWERRVIKDGDKVVVISAAFGG